MSVSDCVISVSQIRSQAAELCLDYSGQEKRPVVSPCTGQGFSQVNTTVLPDVTELGFSQVNTTMLPDVTGLGFSQVNTAVLPHVTALGFSQVNSAALQGWRSIR